MTPPHCRHRPSCPNGTQTWVCSKRTEVEAALERGKLTEAEARGLLSKYGVPLSAPSKVYKGQPLPAAKPGALW